MACACYYFFLSQCGKSVERGRKKERKKEKNVSESEQVGEHRRLV